MKARTWTVLAFLILPAIIWANEWVEGEVKRVDIANAKVTIKHEEIKDLGMPPMTMVFTLKDPEWVKRLTPGQQIRFQAKDLGGGKLEIEALEPKSK
jgi:Cu/Ag efflux protein CusF